MTAILKHEPCDGERWALAETTRTLRRHRGDETIRYRHFGMFDSATGLPIFILWPLRQRKAA
jgi:hypothetical protein